MAAALITAAFLSLAALVVSLVLGMTANDSAGLLRHTTTSIFATMLTLLTHSMMMFYFIGKGKAVREAVTEGNLSRDFVAEISHARRPVFSIATLAMLLTIAAAIVGGGVDVGSMPAGFHQVLAWSAVIANMSAIRIEFRALAASSRVVAAIDRLLA
ncbi:MAG: hypothetical protein ACRD1S_05340 [Vicinamibacterales bacterium]